MAKRLAEREHHIHTDTYTAQTSNCPPRSHAQTYTLYFVFPRFLFFFEKKGKYKGAIEEIGKAIIAVPGGAGSREGGQYSIWLGQAFDANGERGKVRD